MSLFVDDLVASERNAILRLAEKPAVAVGGRWRYRGSRRFLAPSVAARLQGFGLGRRDGLLLVLSDSGRSFAAELRARRRRAA